MRKAASTATGFLAITARQRERLHRDLKTATDARLYRRLLALVQIDRGKSVSLVARELEVNRITVHRWLRRFLDARDPVAVADRAGRGRPPLWSPQMQTLLEQAIRLPPSHAGHLSTQWTLPLLQEHFLRMTGQRLSLTTLRRRLHGLDYVYKRPRYRLQPDPEYRKKTPITDASGWSLPRDRGVGAR
jgi:transposase